MAVPRSMNLVCFYYKPSHLKNISIEKQNSLNEKLLNRLNSSGKIYLTHTKVNDVFIMRMSIGRTNVEHVHISNAWDFIQETAKSQFF